MRKITRFEGKSVTIDGVVGTIHQPKENGFCEFVYRDEGTIESVRVARKYLSVRGTGNYRVHTKYLEVVQGSKRRYYKELQNWSGSYPNGDYAGRDQDLKCAGL